MGKYRANGAFTKLESWPPATILYKLSVTSTTFLPRIKIPSHVIDVLELIPNHCQVCFANGFAALSFAFINSSAPEVYTSQVWLPYTVTPRGITIWSFLIWKCIPHNCILNSHLNTPLFPTLLWLHPMLTRMWWHLFTFELDFGEFDTYVVRCRMSWGAVVRRRTLRNVQLLLSCSIPQWGWNSN